MPRKAMNCRVGFTLIELLVTILVIVIMSGFLITALSGVRETARQMRTQQFIMRLHSQLIPRYQAFRTRPLPVNPFDSIPPIAAADVNNATVTQERARIAWFKHWGTRALMAMELPDSFGDLMLQTPWLQNTAAGNQVGGATVPYVPSMTSMYMDHIRFNVQPPPQGAELQTTVQGNLQLLNRIESQSQTNLSGAECLYMIIEASITDRDLYNVCFNDTDVGDTNSNGLPEFLDAWGTPIYFTRWPAGFISDLQPMYRYDATGIVAGASTVKYQDVYGSNHPRDRFKTNVILSRFPVNGTADERVIGIAGGFHDAFDPYFVDRWEPSPGNAGGYDSGQLIGQTQPPCDGYTPPSLGVGTKDKNWGLPERSYNLTPLIVSAGTDGEYGLAFSSADAGNAALNISAGMNPYLTFVNPYMVFQEMKGSQGQPVGTGRYYQRAAISETSAGSGDNIHNHRATPTTGR